MQTITQKPNDEIKVSYIEGLALIVGPVRIIENATEIRVISYHETFPYNDRAEVQARVQELLANPGILYPAITAGWKEYES